MAESFDIKFERFAAKALQNHAQVLGILSEHGGQLKDVKVNLAKHLNDHLQDLQKLLNDERTKTENLTNVWISSLIGIGGVVVAALALLK